MEYRKASLAFNLIHIRTLYHFFKLTDLLRIMLVLFDAFNEHTNNSHQIKYVYIH